MNALAVGAVLTLVPHVWQLLLPVAHRLEGILPAPAVVLSLLQPDRVANARIAAARPDNFGKERAAASGAENSAAPHGAAAPPSAPRLLPTPVPIAEGIVSISPAARAKERVVPLQIKATPGENYFVRLTNVADEHEVIDVFVRGGSTVTLAIPIGKHRVRFAAGSVWYGDKLLFGQRTSYWTIQIPVAFTVQRRKPKPVFLVLGLKGGNMKTVALDPARF